MPLQWLQILSLQGRKGGNDYYLPRCSTQSPQLRSELDSDGMVHICCSQRKSQTNKQTQNKTKPPNKNRNPASKQAAFTVWRLSGTLKKLRNLYKLGGGKTLAAWVLHKGQGFAVRNRSAGWEWGCYVLSSQAVPVIKRRTIYFKGLTEPVAWTAEKQQVQGKQEGPVRKGKNPHTPKPICRKTGSILVKNSVRKSTSKVI